MLKTNLKAEEFNLMPPLNLAHKNGSIKKKILHATPIPVRP